MLYTRAIICKSLKTQLLSLIHSNHLSMTSTLDHTGTPLRGGKRRMNTFCRALNVHGVLRSSLQKKLRGNKMLSVGRSDHIFKAASS